MCLCKPVAASCCWGSGLESGVPDSRAQLRHPACEQLCVSWSDQAQCKRTASSFLKEQLYNSSRVNRSFDMVKPKRAKTSGQGGIVGPAA
eukprot:scaffold46520_cov13-Tisochrysis_lutea.AAC.1